KPQNKGKAKMVEEPVKPKKKEQIRLDEEADLKLQAKFNEEQRLARERAHKEQEANIALIETLDDVQANIDADHQLAKRLQAEEQQELTNEEKDTLTELVQGQEKEKRAREELIQKRAKKQKVEDNNETTKLKQLMEIIPDKEEVAIDAISLDVNAATTKLLLLGKVKTAQRNTLSDAIEQYMSKTRGNYGSGVIRPKINDKTHFELNDQYLKELCKNTFSGSEHEDAKEHIKKVLEIIDLFHIPEVTQDQVMLRVFHMSLIGAASRWLRNEPSGLITNWETRKIKFLNKYYLPARTAKKMEEINNFQQEPNESLF
nr:hypothetical protein [Tanacetum cinerariifolium]